MNVENKVIRPVKNRILHLFCAAIESPMCTNPTLIQFYALHIHPVIIPICPRTLAQLIMTKNAVAGPVRENYYLFVF